MTTVISVKGQNRIKLLADPSFVYVGRAVKWTKWEASIWGNPFYVWDGELRWDRKRVDAAWVRDRLTLGPTDPVDLFYRWLLQHDSLWDRLGDLCGKRLGCWCGAWEPGQPEIGCHAVELAKLANIADPTFDPSLIPPFKLEAT